jgi:hypothetical protein
MKTPIILNLLVAFAALQICSADAPEESFRTLVGTTTTDASGKTWAFLQWQAQDPGLLSGRAYAVFAKDGNATSTNSYAHVATMQMQTNAAVLEAIAATSDRVGSFEEELEKTVNDLFEDLVPADTLTLGQKLSVVMFSARKDPKVHETLVFLAKLHPIVGVCLGTSVVVAADATNETTFELRAPRIPGRTNLETYDAVVGRVTVDPKNVLVLPEPGSPVHLADTTPTGNLNVHLRWGTPDAIKRLAMFHYGYNVYRVPKAFAESNGWHTARPGVGDLAAAPEAYATNMLPILPKEVMTLTEAATFAEPEPVDEVYFVIDDNDRFAEGGSPLNDGDQFYYYVVPRDILGRDGESSTGTLVTICATMPPLPPSDVEVTNEYSYDKGSNTSDQRLKVTWEPSPESETTPTGYVVYRWENMRGFQRFTGADPASIPQKVSAIIPHVDGQERYEFIDSGAGAPQSPMDQGKTYWYTVKAVFSGACGDVYSGDSAPKFGVLRDRKGPRSKGTKITRTCTRTTIDKDISFFAADNVPQGMVPVRFKVRRNSENTTHPEAFSIGLRTTTKTIAGSQQETDLRPLGSYEIPKSGQAEAEVLLPMQALAKDCVDICIRFPGVKPFYCPTDDIIRELVQRDNVNGICITVIVTTVVIKKDKEIGVDGRGSIHETTGEDGTVNPVEVTMFLPLDAAEWKLYKQVDDGEMTMVEQGTGAPGEITVLDYKMPANSAQVCYLVQYFDRHGNPSPLEFLDCLRTTSKVAMPVPMLNVPEPARGAPEGTTKLTWFCDVDGVERFKVCISDGLTRFQRGSYSDELTLGAGLVATSTHVFSCFTTGRVGGNFGDGGAYHELELSLSPGREYHFMVSSVSAAGDESVSSNEVSFIWREPADEALDEVPWPARPLPVVDPNFIPEVIAEYIIDGEQEYLGAAVRIGELTGFNDQSVDYGLLVPEQPVTQVVFSPTRLTTNDAPASLEDYLYTSRGGKTVLSCVLYRRQIPTEGFPSVSGTTVQVSPLVDRIREKYETLGSVLSIYDPFILIHQTAEDLKNKKVGIYLKDTQGVIAGAAYRYTLVRFSENKEIDRIIPAGDVTLVPEPAP